MTPAPLLADLERQGFRFELRGDRLKVRGPAGALDDNAVKRLRRQKQRLMAEVRLRDFIDLVRAAGACSHQILLHRSAILAELDEADREALAATTPAERREWAELLAGRLARRRIAT